MALTPLPTAPSTSDPANFATRADAFVAALATLVTEINSGQVELTAGTLTGNLLFTDATYDIGASGATRPRDFFLSRNATIGGTLIESTGAAWTTYVPTLTTDTGTFGALTVTNASYRLLGKTLIIKFDCRATVASGSPTEFRLSLPTGTLKVATQGAAYIYNNTTQEIGIISSPAGGAYIAFARVGGAAFTGLVLVLQSIVVELA